MEHYETSHMHFNNQLHIRCACGVEFSDYLDHVAEREFSEHVERAAEGEDE